MIYMLNPSSAEDIVTREVLYYNIAIYNIKKCRRGAARLLLLEGMVTKYTVVDRVIA